MHQVYDVEGFICYRNNSTIGSHMVGMVLFLDYLLI